MRQQRLNRVETNPIDPYRTHDIPERLLANILEEEMELALHVLLHSARNTNSTRLGQRLKACRHIHVFAPNVATVHDDVADVYTHAELNPLFSRDVEIAPRHAALEFHGTLHSIDDAGELSQNSIAGNSDDPTV